VRSFAQMYRLDQDKHTDSLSIVTGCKAENMATDVVVLMGMCGRYFWFFPCNRK
jgi:hypothetical protein